MIFNFFTPGGVFCFGPYDRIDDFVTFTLVAMNAATGPT
jgi:hypothetical protein